MSRIAKFPIPVPTEVQIELSQQFVVLTGKQGVLRHKIPHGVSVQFEAQTLKVVPVSTDRRARSLAGTLRANLNNQVTGVSKGFQCVLNLVGVGYRAQIQSSELVLNIGFSKPKLYRMPEGVEIEVPNPTEIVVKGSNIQQVYQVAAEIRRFRPPGAYQGTGIRLAREKITLKETKKK